MTTSRRLWIGFGTLTALLVLFGVALALRLQSIEANVAAQSNVDRPRSAAVRELEIDVVSYALAVRLFTQTDDPKFRREAAEHSADVGRQLADYERLAATDRQRELATRFADDWREYASHGQTILDSNDRPLKREDFESLVDLRTQLQKFLDDEMRPDAVASYDVQTRATFQDARSIVEFALILLGVGTVIAVVTSSAVGRTVVKSERTVVEQAERLRTTLASIGDAVLSTDTGGRITNMNPMAEALTGWTNAEASGQPLDAVFRIVNETTRQTVENPATRALREGVIVGLANHTLLIARDGTERPIDDSAAPIRCAEGKVVGCVLVFRDVAERRTAERFLQASEARKTAMFEAALDCIISIDHEGTITEFNTAAERTFGHRREDVLGRELAELIIPPVYRERHRKGLLRYLATGEGPVLNQRLELSALRADGSEFPVELTVTRIRIDGPASFTAYLRDITERKRSEQALRNSEENHRALFASAPMAVFVCDQNAVIQHYNDRAVELWGREPVCGVEQHCGSMKLWLPNGELLPHSQSPMVEVLRTGVSVRGVEVFIERPDGSRLPVLVNFAALKNAAGEITGAITSFVDITDRKRNEELLHESEAFSRGVFEGSPDCVKVLDVEGRLLRMNVNGLCLMEIDDFAAVEGRPWSELWPEEARSEVLSSLETAVAVGMSRFQHFCPTAKGTSKWWDVLVAPIRDSAGNLIRFVSVSRDITERKRAEALLASHQQVLEMLARGEQLEDVLEFLAREMESLSEGGFLVAIHLLEPDARHFGYVAAPSLPASYAQATKGMDAHLQLGPCSSAVVACASTFVHDFAVETRWPAFTAQAIELGIHGCFTTPIISSDQTILGTFAIYYREPRTPSSDDQQLVEIVTRTACIAIERRLADEATSRLAAIVTSSADAIISKDLNGVITSWNRGAEHLFGYTAAEAVGKPVTLLIPEDHINEEPRILERVWRGEVIDHYETVRRRKDGGLLDISLTVSPVKDAAGRIIGASKIARDISDRKRVEEQLREAEEQFHTLAENITQLAWMARKDGHIYWYNRRWYEYTGTTPETQAGWGWESVHDPDMLPLVQERWNLSLTTGEPFDMVFPLKGADGNFRPFLTRVMPVKDAEGRVVQWFGTNTDVTEQRETENKLRQVAAELSEADRRKNEFLAILAHELRNPLAPLRNGLQLMELAKDEPEAVEQSRTMMERQLGQMVRLIDDLMDVSRISRGKVELRKQRIPMDSILNSAIETSRPLIEELGHELTVSLPRPAVVLNADLTRLAQVFLNLLNNAAKYTNPGGRIQLTALRQGSDVVVSIKDSGIGIAADHLPRVFEMFSQVDRSLEKSHGGLGIGLTLVRRLVEMHGGTVEGRSAGPGQGSEFVVRLPIVADDSPPDDEELRPRVPQAIPNSSLRILVVDDNRDGADSLARMLKTTGNITRTAYDGAAALTAAAEFRPDVILLDIGLPLLNGYEVCRRIREQPWGQESVIIAQTGWGAEEDRQRTHEAGFDHHLVKPVNPASLLKLLAGISSTPR